MNITEDLTNIEQINDKGFVVNSVNNSNTDPFKTVLEWLEVAGVEKKSIPHFPSPDKFKLFLKLMLEELTECAESGGLHGVSMFKSLLEQTLSSLYTKTYSKEQDFTEYRDAIADMTYILGNGIRFSGLDIVVKDKPLYKHDFDEVSRSNFSKFCLTEQEADATQNKYDQLGIATKAVKVNSYYVVLRAEDNKILKGINFSDVQLRKI